MVEPLEMFCRADWGCFSPQPPSLRFKWPLVPL